MELCWRRGRISATSGDGTSGTSTDRRSTGSPVSKVFTTHLGLSADEPLEPLFSSVSVGYVYTDCSFIFWTRQVVKMAGYTQPISDLGGWNLDVHHHYDIHGGKTYQHNMTLLKAIDSLLVPIGFRCTAEG